MLNMAAKIFENYDDEFEIEYYREVDGKPVFILNNFIDQIKLTPHYQKLAHMIGKEKVVMLNIHQATFKTFYMKPTLFDPKVKEKVEIPLKVWRNYWVTGRGIGKSWWPHTNFQFEAPDVPYDSAFLVKGLNEAPLPVRSSKQVYAEVEDQYGYEWESRTTRNETQSSGFIKAYNMEFEEWKKQKVAERILPRVMLSGSFEALTKLAHRVNEVEILTRVYADELVSHNKKSYLTQEEWEDYENSIKGSLFKKAKDRMIPYLFNAFMNKWDKDFPVIEYVDKYVDYTNDVRPWFLKNPIENNFMVFYVPDDKTCIVNATKFNSMVIRESRERQVNLESMLTKALEINDLYAIAEILGETYQGADVQSDYIYRKSIPSDYQFGVVDGSKDPVFDVGIDIDPNKVIEVVASQLVYVGDEPHVNVYPIKSIPVNFKGRTPLKAEMDQISMDILEAISDISMESGLYIRNVWIDDNFGWIVGSVQGMAEELGIYGINWDKPRQKKDEWNIMTRQKWFNTFFPKGWIHLVDDPSTHDMLDDFKAVKRAEGSAANRFKSVNKRADGNDHKINAFEYSLQTIKDMYLGIDDFFPVKTDYTI